jgi:Ni,Fe-hydrogenase III small subunit
MPQLTTGKSRASCIGVAISDALIGWHCAQQEAVAAMKRIVRAMPAARSVLIAGLAAAYAGLSDDFPEVHSSLRVVVCVQRLLQGV